MTGEADTPRRGPAYRVVTERLTIRCWQPSDAPRVRASLDASDAHLRPWIPFMKHEPRTLEETAVWLRRHRGTFDLDRHYRYGIFARDEAELFGETMLIDRAGEADMREIGYWIDARRGGRGYATESTAALARVGFELLGLRRIEIHCAPENAASAAVPAKLGFRHEATLKERFVDTEGALRDLMVWTLFAEDFPASPASRVTVAAFDAAGRPLALHARPPADGAPATA